MPVHSPNLVKLLVFRMLVLVVAVMAVFLLLTSAAAYGPAGPTVEHVVAPGETLWEIASTVADEAVDRREVVRSIQALNDLTDAVIHPGQTLLLPLS